MTFVVLSSYRYRRHYMRPVTPQARGGYSYATMSVDQQSKWKEVFLMKDKDDHGRLLSASAWSIYFRPKRLLDFSLTLPLGKRRCASFFKKSNNQPSPSDQSFWLTSP